MWELRVMVSEKGIHAEWQPRIGSQTPSKKKRVSTHGWRWGWKSKVGYIQDDQTGECLRIIGANFPTLEEESYNAKEENLNSMRISKQIIRNMEKKTKTVCSQFWRKQYAPGKVDVRQMHKLCHELLIQRLKTYDYNKDKYFKESIWCSLHSQSFPTLCNHMDCSSPGSSVYGIFQARMILLISNTWTK